MRLLAILCLLMAAPLGVFSWLGIYTADGRHVFDEMAGVVPFAAGVAGVLLLALAAIAGWWSARRRRKMSRAARRIA